MNSQYIKFGIAVGICQFFYNFAISGHFGTFFIFLKEPWPYFTTEFRPKKENIECLPMQFKLH